jgi:TATA-binding protein-associated factor Taf7
VVLGRHSTSGSGGDHTELPLPFNFSSPPGKNNNNNRERQQQRKNEEDEDDDDETEEEENHSLLIPSPLRQSATGLSERRNDSGLSLNHPTTINTNHHEESDDNFLKEVWNFFIRSFLSFI